MTDDSTRLAVLIDADNTSPKLTDYNDHGLYFRDPLELPQVIVCQP